MPLHLRAGHPLLVTGSFFLYGQKTEELVRMQTTQIRSDAPFDDAIKTHHNRLVNKDSEAVINALYGEFNSLEDDLPNYKARVLSPYNSKDPETQPADEFERSTLASFVQAAQKEDRQQKTSKTRDKVRFADGTPTVGGTSTTNANGKKEFQYIQAVLFQARLPDGLSRWARRTIDNHMSRPDGRRPRLGLSQGGRPGRRRGDQPCRWSRPTTRSTATAPC